MTPQQQRELAAPLVDIYEGVVDDLLTLVAKQLGKYSGITETADWQMKQLAALGALNRKTIQTIAQRTGIAPELLAVAAENAAWSAIGDIEPALQEAAREGLAYNVQTAADDTAMQAAKAYQAQAKDTLNMVNTVMQYKARETFVAAVSKVFAADAENRDKLLRTLGKHTAGVVTGARSRQDALRACIREMAEQGIPAFVDRAGREWSPEAYINMDIRTTVSNTANAAQFARLDEYGVDLVSVSSHMGARPLCAKDQGKIFSRSNKSGYTEDLEGRRIRYYPWASSSYGKPAGLLGINCGHHLSPFIPSYSYLSYDKYDEKENAEAYKQSQQQRRLEREVRRAKRECMMLDAAGDKEGFAEASLRLKDRRNTLSSFLKDTGRTMRDDRAQMVGFNRSVSRKANVSVANSIKSGKLLPKHDRAINDYISARSYRINDALRCGAELNSNEKRIVRDLDSALSLLPDYKGTVYRSMSSSMMDINLFNALHQIGNVISYEAYTSTSKAIYDDSMDIQLVIKAIHAKDISVWNVSEQEVLFGRNSYFIVKNRRGNIVFMEEMEYG